MSEYLLDIEIFRVDIYPMIIFASVETSCAGIKNEVFAFFTQPTNLFWVAVLVVGLLLLFHCVLIYLFIESKSHCIANKLRLCPDCTRRLYVDSMSISQVTCK